MTTSDEAWEECFVYLQMPGTLEVVVCGRYVREATRSGGSVDRFVYGRALRQGGSERDCHLIEPAFRYPGFDYAST